MKSRFLTPSSIVTELDNNIFNFFENLIFHSRLIYNYQLRIYNAPISQKIFLVDDSFVIFSFTYNFSDLNKTNYKFFLFPNLTEEQNLGGYQILIDHIFKHEIEKQNIEIILANDQTFIINVKINNNKLFTFN